MTSACTRTRKRARARGSLLVEVSLAMGLTAVLALMSMRASLLAISGNQWTLMQTLTDARLTRETALANRIPLADLTAEASEWPDAETDDPPQSRQTITLGKMAGGKAVTGELIRFRQDETDTTETDTGMKVWRLHSILHYSVGEKKYVKSRSCLRMQ